MRYAVLFGPPNVGKSTLFNHLTESNSKVINYPGSTVDIHVSPLKRHNSVTLIDAPGIQSLLPRSDEERLALQAITQLNAIIAVAHPMPDLIICVIDTTKADRHLAITKRLIDDGYPVIVILTMIDEARKKGIELDHIKLANHLGVSTFIVNARNSTDMPAISAGISMNSIPCNRITKPKPCHLNDILDSYEWARSVISKCQTIKKSPPIFDLDRWLLHPLAGYVAFIGIMVSFFSMLFYLAVPAMDMIDTVFATISEFASDQIQHEGINNFIVNGIIAGIGGVVIFIPQIALLFFGLGIMESTGFLARSAVLIDRPLSKIGLNGRSFVPLLSGFACAIPAILATRVIPNRRVRILTMLGIPLMQCAARLPVYGLLLGALFTSPMLGGIGLTTIYVLSILIAGVIIGIANRVLTLEAPAPFIIELPTWRWPMWRELLMDTCRKTNRFLLGAGPIILGVSILIWACAEINVRDQPIIYWIGQAIEPIFKPMGVDWKVGVAILLSFAAREVFVSSLAMVYQVSDPSLTTIASINKLAVFSDTGTVIGLILFFIVAMQCGATVGVLKKEMGNIKWPSLILVAYMLIAYALSVIANALM